MNTPKPIEVIELDENIFLPVVIQLRAEPQNGHLDPRETLTRMERTYHERRHHGAFITHSQPEEKP